MNIDKQDERLLHEILSKYKQGLISGLIQGNNVTFTSTGCRNKVISSTGGGSSALFPNGIEFVNASRDFRASDAGKRLFVSGENAVISMPEVNPFAVGDYVGIINNGDNIISFTTEYGGEPIFPLKTGDGSTSECVILMNTEIEGSSWLFPISTSFKYDETDSKKKTALKYLYDQSQNVIPLSGTEVGSPVTGDIEVFNGFDLKTPNASANEFHSLYMDDGGIQLKYNNSSVANSFIAEDDGFSITSDNASFRGFKGDADYSAAYQVNDYTQLVYVGYRGTATLSSGTVTVTTDKIKTGYKIYLSVNTPSGTQGFLSAPTGSIVDETEFVINSTSATDDSTVNWWIAP